MNVSKKERSNEQRLRALGEKKKLLEARKFSINVSSARATSQHLVFDSDSDESVTNDVDPDDTLDSKLELFGKSSSSDSEEELGTKFMGDLGGRLFKLQQRIGHDQRFRVDKRFLEDEDGWEEQSHDKAETKDKQREQILQEKANALRIISSLFGGDQTWTKVQASDSKQSLTKHHLLASEYPVLPVRYDPSLPTCAQLEIQPEAGSPSQRELHSSDKGGSSPTDDSCPQAPSQQCDSISTDRYYSVSEDIKDLFSSSKGQFSFLAEVEDDSHESSLSSDLPLNTNSAVTAPKWLDTISKHSAESADYGNKIAIADCQANSSDAASMVRTKLFFHSSTPSLRNRLDENNFYRSESLRDLETDWPQTRTAMKQSFRKRRKDAVKHAKKRRKHLK